MEKRRRARINNSLSELKNLILDALKKDNARHSKLEKADILEMTVKHLQNLQMQQQQQQLTPDHAMMAKFRAGFAECANEVSRFMGSMEGVDHTVRQRLLNHLANCLTGMNNPPPTPLPPVHVQVSNDSQDHSTTKVFGGVHLVPTRLPSGEIAFLLPAVYAPSTVPISPASSTSSVSSPLSSASPVNVLGSSGILSPASSDRSSPSPIMHSRIHQDVIMSSHSPVSVMSQSPVPMMPQSPLHMMSPNNAISVISSHCPPVISPQSKAVWRPF